MRGKPALEGKRKADPSRQDSGLARRGGHPAILQHPNHLQVIIDIRYQYAIMTSLSGHDFSVLCEQWAPATRFF
jgi:hypothetical protein